MLRAHGVRQMAVTGIVILSMLLVAGTWLVLATWAEAQSIRAAPAPAGGRLVVLAWNDLGMHCYNRNFQDLAVLPPYNTLWAQVVRTGDPPQIVTSGITVTYLFTDNTYSVGKSDFWSYTLPLFGSVLTPNIGLTGKGLSGPMDNRGDHFSAEGIPLTEFRDSASAIAYPYQIATIIVSDAGSGAELARTTTVAPVSTEMHCDSCHHDYGVDNIATGRVELNILTLHDREELANYPPGHTTALVDRRPVLCAECHSSNALGAPGVAGLLSLANAMHQRHDGRVPDDITGCYNCHPGPQTQCLRDVMSQRYGMSCINCHGTMAAVSVNPNPWLNEPRCDNSACHGVKYAQDQALYRHSKDHGGIYCEGCHDSTHAIAPSGQPNDGAKFIQWQRYNGTLGTCTVCHATMPAAPGPHGSAPHGPVYLPAVQR